MTYHWTALGAALLFVAGWAWVAYLLLKRKERRERSRAARKLEKVLIQEPDTLLPGSISYYKGPPVVALKPFTVDAATLRACDGRRRLDDALFSRTLRAMERERHALIVNPPVMEIPFSDDGLRLDLLRPAEEPAPEPWQGNGGESGGGGASGSWDEPAVTQELPQCNPGDDQT